MGKGMVPYVQADTGAQVYTTQPQVCETCNGIGERLCGEYIAVEKKKKLRIKN
jgi:hypothetical protein